jgi:hypothetical protein
MDAEHLERKAANVAWLKQAFAEAKAAGSRGVVILTQANPGFETFWPASANTRYLLRFIPRGQPAPSRLLAFDDYVQTLSEERTPTTGRSPSCMAIPISFASTSRSTARRPIACSRISRA